MSRSNLTLGTAPCPATRSSGGWAEAEPHQGQDAQVSAMSRCQSNSNHLGASQLG